MIWLARFIIFADLVLPIVYIVSPKFTVLRITAVLLSIIVLFFGAKGEPISKSTWSLMRWAMGLVFFKLVVDSTIHSDGSLSALTQFLREIFVILMLPVFEKIGDNKIRLIKTLVVCSIPAIVLGYLQIFDNSLTVSKLLPSNPFLFTDATTDLYIKITSRVVGTYNIAIGLALLLGVLIVIFWSFSTTNRPAKTKTLLIVAMGICFILMVFTQTRSAIYGIFPTLLLTYMIATPGIAKKSVLTVVAGLVFALGFVGFQSFITTYSERSEVKVDSNTYYKITANIYGTYAALARDPLFGVAINSDKGTAHQEYLDLINEGKAALGFLIKVDGDGGKKLTATNHNLFAYFMRHYGLIGFFLLMMVIYQYFRKAMGEMDIQKRYMTLGVLIYFLQYSMLHNTQLAETLLLWVILTASGKHVNKIKKETESVGVNVCFQRRSPTILGTRKHSPADI